MVSSTGSLITVESVVTVAASMVCGTISVITGVYGNDSSGIPTIPLQSAAANPIVKS